MTVDDLISLALLDSGIIGQGQSASAEDMNNAFLRLNMLLSQWTRKRWLVYALEDVFCATTGAQSYTIGAGGDFNMTRPDRLEEGNFFRQFAGTQGQVDYPLQLFKSREDYNQIVVKKIGTWPSGIFYDNSFPVGHIYVWPVPASGYEIHLNVKTPLAQLTSITQSISFPPEYEPALFYNLIVRLRAAYQMPPDPVMIGLAKESLNVLREANAQIATLNMPNAVQNRKWAYNVYSDQP
jgi:hypothetical protein